MIPCIRCGCWSKHWEETGTKCDCKLQCNNPDCEAYHESQTFDGVVQIRENEANIFEVGSDLTLGKNRDVSLGELPTESSADPDRKLPYLKRVDCSSCGEPVWDIDEHSNTESVENLQGIEMTGETQLNMFYSYHVEEDNEGFYVKMYDNNAEEEHDVCFCKSKKIANAVMNYFDNLSIQEERDLFEDTTPIMEFV